MTTNIEVPPKRGEPVVVSDTDYRRFFGALRINYRVEDRRPDVPSYDSKYKNWFTVYAFGRRMSGLQMRTPCRYDDDDYFCRFMRELGFTATINRI